MTQSTQELAHQYAQLLQVQTAECERMMAKWSDKVQAGVVMQTHEFALCWKIVRTAQAGIHDHRVAHWRDELDYVLETALEVVSE